MTFLKLILSLIFIVIVFGKGAHQISDSTLFIGMCMLLSSWIFGSAIEEIGETFKKVKDGFDSFIKEYGKVLKEAYGEVEEEEH